MYMSNLDDNASVRCKACDKLFSSVWREDIKQWEDMCWECIGLSFVNDDSDAEDWELCAVLEAYNEAKSEDDTGTY